MTIKNIFFDLDGTIIDPKEGIVNAILYGLEKMGIEEKNKKALEDFIGPPFPESFRNRYNLNPSDIQKTIHFTREYFSTQGIKENFLYPNMKVFLQTLKKKNFELFITTSKPTIFAKKIAQNHNIQKFFTDIVGSNLNNTRTQKSEILDYTIKKHLLKTEETIMIGDRKYDILGAKNHNMKSIGVLYGYGSHEELKNAGANFLAKDVYELEKILKEI